MGNLLQIILWDISHLSSLIKLSTFLLLTSLLLLTPHLQATTLTDLLPPCAKPA